MAPPPSPDLPLGERLRALAQTLQFAWFIGHSILLLSVSRYFLSYVSFRYYSTSAQIAYRLAFLSAAATYGIVVYKQYVARGLPQGGARSLLPRLVTDENVQYLGMALLWLNSRQIPLALLPFTVYSVFHVATYTRSYLIPTFQPSKPAAGQSASSPSSNSAFPSSPRPTPPRSPLADSIGRFIKQYYDASMGLVATLELVLLFRLALSALTFTKGSWILLLAYLSFFRSRYAQSMFVQQSVRHVTARVDTLVAHQSTPPQVRQGWDAFKNLVRQGYESLDANSAAAKKPQ